MNRRQFLVRAAASCGALITPSFVQQAIAYIEREAQPLLVKPKGRITRTLYAEWSHDHYCMYLGLPDAEPPELTWREFAQKQGCDSDLRELLEWMAEYGPEQDSLIALRRSINEPVPPEDVFDWWRSAESPNELGFDYLASLNLGPEFDERPNGRGQVRFVEGYEWGNDMKLVEVADDLSLSLLQARLNELNEAAEIKRWAGPYGAGILGCSQ